MFIDHKGDSAFDLRLDAIEDSLLDLCESFLWGLGDGGEGGLSRKQVLWERGVDVGLGGDEGLDLGEVWFQVVLYQVEGNQVLLGESYDGGGGQG